MKPKSLTVLVPMYNERDNVERTISKLSEFLPGLGVKWEVLVVDDGSTDGTGKILDSLAGHGVRVIHHESNRGQAAGLMTGFSGASMDYILTIDSDLSFPLENIRVIMDRALRSGADATIGTYYKKGNYANVSRYRILLGKLGNMVYRLVFPVKLKQYTCNFRLYRAETARQIEFDPESRFVGKVAIILDLMRKGRKIDQVYVTLVPRKKGKSKFRFTDIFRHLRFSMRIVRMRLGGEFVQPSSLPEAVTARKSRARRD